MLTTNPRVASKPMPSALVAMSALIEPEASASSSARRSVCSVCPEYAATSWPRERRYPAISCVAATVRQ